MTRAAVPLFSIVIPTSNRAALLADALRSVFAQRLTDFEVIVIDDGSSDDTAALLAAHEGRLAWYRQERAGPGAARNAGSARARGTYLAFLDSDDVWFPWTLDVYAQVIRQADEPAFLVGTPTYFTELDECREVPEGPTGLKVFADYYASQEAWRWWGASALVIRRDVFSAVGGFTDEWVNGEDADLALRLGVSPGFIQVCTPSTFGYRRHADTAMSNVDRTIAGAWRMLNVEREGGYPGGAARATARRQILSRHLRSVMLEMQRRGWAHEAWRMYRATFGWHVRLRRWRFLLAFPLLAVRHSWSATFSRSPSA